MRNLCLNFLAGFTAFACIAIPLSAQEPAVEAPPPESGPVEAVATPTPAPVPTPVPPAKPVEPAPEPVPSEPTAEVVPRLDERGAQPDFYNRFIRQRLELGTRAFVSRSLDTTSQGDDTPARDDNYFGSIDRLDPDFSSAPTAFYIQYALCDYAGIGLTFDDFDMATQDAPYTAANTDGDITVESTYLYLFARYPNTYNLVPFCELGYGQHDIGFSPDPGWAARGNRVVMDNDSGVFYSIGVEYYFTPELSCNLIFRSVNISASGEYRVDDGRKPIPFSESFDHTAWGLGVKYTF
jgi:hypothetical protein